MSATSPDQKSAFDHDVRIAAEALCCPNGCEGEDRCCAEALWGSTAARVVAGLRGRHRMLVNSTEPNHP